MSLAFCKSLIEENTFINSKYVANIRNIILCLTLLLAGFLALRSIYFGVILLRPLPTWDQWWFIYSLFDYMDGRITLFKFLFSQHNEHRIFTSRLLFVVDAFTFKMSNASLIFVIYLGLVTIGALLAAIATRGKNLFFAIIVSSGLMLSISQWENLSWGFQPQFILVHLFALTTLFAFIRLLEASTDRERATYFFLALLSDFMCVYSLSSGLLIGVSLIFIALCYKNKSSFVNGFILYHILISGVYFLDYAKPERHPWGQVSLAGAFDYIFLYLTSTLHQGDRLRLVLGFALFSLPIIFSIYLFLRSYLAKIKPQAFEATLAGIAIFILLEACATAYGRAGFGLLQASSARYATPSNILMLATFAYLWRMSEGLSLPIKNLSQSLCLLAGCFILLSSNAGFFLDKWHDSIHDRDVAANALLRGEYFGPDFKDIIASPDPNSFVSVVSRLKGYGWAGLVDAKIPQH